MDQITRFTQTTRVLATAVLSLSIVSFMPVAPKAATVKPAFSKVDADGDHNISKDEARKAGLSKLVSQWQSADADNDSVLSKSEYKPGKKAKFSKVDADKSGSISKKEAQKAGLSTLASNWDAADADENGSLNKKEFKSFKQEHKLKPGKSGRKPKPAQKFAQADANGNGELTKAEARSAGLAQLVQKWDQADSDATNTLSKAEFTSYMKKHKGLSQKPQKAFPQVDANSDKKVSKSEVQKAGMTKLLKSWNAADKDNSGLLSKTEFTGFMKKPGDKKPSPMTVGLNKFKSPETVLWDEKADVYLVSNINGKLTARDDNGFISRVAPDGTITDLKWIDGGKPEVALHGPKGMIFHDKYLLVADVGAVRFFDRTTGKPLHSIIVKGSYMLNDLAVSPDGTIYVSDVGSAVAEPPGAVYRLGVEETPTELVKGIDYDRPDGLIWHGNGLLVAPFEKHAKDLYELSLDGKRSTFKTLPKPKLDGLLRLPDESIIVTSWGGKRIFRIADGKVSVVAKGIPSPAQIDYDEKRRRLLVPVLRENKLLVYPLEAGN